MRHLTLIPLAAALSISAIAAAPASAASEEELKAGKRVYMTKTCLACHGRGGAKPIMTYPALAGQSEKYLIQQMEDIRDGERVGSVDPATGHPFVQGMTDIMHLLTEDDIVNVSKWLAAQPPGPPAPLEPAPEPALLEEGAKAYKQLGCRSCHGKEGDKATHPAYPIIAGLDRDYLVRSMTEIRDKERTSGKAKLMWGTIKKADDAEIAAIATWLATIDLTVE